ncbi:MAG: stage V sporulation protein AD [Clostridia bacterium]|nr:stage V sporulation protein AD [Clostridia bacterium]
MARLGKSSFEFASKPQLISSASFVSEKERTGPLGGDFDVCCKDDTLGLKSWEKAESRMFESAVRLALFKLGRRSEELDCLIGGDLLDQIISSGFAARELRAPFIGLYSACSTITEALMLGGMLMEGGFARLVACAASSHFSSVERQYRFPLEMGTQSTPTAQRTVTGAGCVLLASSDAGERTPVFENAAMTGGTIGTVVDYGVTDASNMGAAMAPAAAHTIKRHLEDTARDPSDFDLILTGDLGRFGTEMLLELLAGEGINIEAVHEDCGKLIFGDDPKTVCGGSGAGCAASVFASHILPKVDAGEYKKVLFLATGALLSPVSSLQGESIPAIAHAVVVEHAGRTERIGNTKRKE